MENLALYREYRPKNFDEVIGQDHIVKTLKNQIKTSNLSHAYLFCGTRGTGKTSTAKIFAKSINCEQNQDGSPCYNCPTCKALSDNGALDILEIDAASNNRVDEIRDLREKIKYPPVNGKYKVYIIDEVHMLTDSAYNALLKTLEEPPKHAMFILCTTEVHKLPQTILSRCMRFDFHLVKLNDLVNLLKKIFNEKNVKFEEEALHLIASRGEGSVRDTLSIADLCVSFSNKNVTYKSVLDALGSSSTDSLVEIANAISENDGEKLLTTINILAESGKNFTILGKELVNHFKTLLTIKSVTNAQQFLMLPDDIFNSLNSQANKFSQQELLNAMTKLSSIETQLKFSINPRTLIEIALLGLLDLEKKTEFVENSQKKTKNVNLEENFSEKELKTKENGEKENLTNGKIKISKEEVEINKNLEDFQNKEKINNFVVNNDKVEKTEIKKDILNNNAYFEDLNENIVENNDIFNEIQDKKIFDNKPKNENLNAQIVVAKILKKLREEKKHLLSSVFQSLKDVEIDKNMLNIHFNGENFKEILEKSEHYLLFNDIIKEDNLTISFVYDKVVVEKSTEEILKEKFNNIEIKE